MRIVELIFGRMSFSLSLKVPKRHQGKWLIVGGGAMVLSAAVVGHVVTRQACHQVAVLSQQMHQMQSRMDSIVRQQAELSETVTATRHAIELDRDKEWSHLIELVGAIAETRPAKLSNAQLIRRAMALIHRIREMNERQKEQDEAEMQSEMLERRNSNATQLQELMAKFISRNQRLHTAQEYELQMNLVGEMEYVMGELKNRVPNLPVPQGPTRIALTGHLVGPDPLFSLANYLELAVKKLQ